MKSLLSVTQASPSALKDIAKHLDRIATSLETFLYHAYDIASPTRKTDTSGDDPVAVYTDDEKAWTQEYLRSLGKDEEEAERLTAEMDEQE